MRFKVNKKKLVLSLIGLAATLILHYLIFGNTIYFYNQEKEEFGGKQGTVVIKPLLTANAYKKGGFYDYYKGKCDAKCLTVTIDDGMPYKYSASESAIVVLEALDYDFITDYQLHKDPSLIKQYEKVILLHSEYVTGEIFDAIISHPNVVYLYPNALYAQVAIQDDKMTLIRGHSYEDGQYPVEVSNGFGWIYDNHDQEYDKECKNWQFYPIDNGWMLNCYPENIIIKNKQLLRELAQVSTIQQKCIGGQILYYPENCSSLK